jgi:hypothetical protein
LECNSEFKSAVKNDRTFFIFFSCQKMKNQ